jgi:hypothetical protein
MKREVTLVSVAALLGGCYLYFFTNSFSGAKPIQAYAQVRFVGTGFGRSKVKKQDDGEVDAMPVSFTFDDKYQLTELKVVNADEYKTNKYAHIMWHMISDRTSAPTKGFLYGSKIQGMKPSIPRGKPDPLEPDTNYLLLVTAGKSRGEVPFRTKAPRPS